LRFQKLNVCLDNVIGKIGLLILISKPQGMVPLEAAGAAFPVPRLHRIEKQAVGSKACGLPEASM
jgi:hypothetical protein